MILILTNIHFAYLEVVFLRRAEGQSVQLFCIPDPVQTDRALSSVTLSSRLGLVPKWLHFTAEGREVRVSPEYQGRLKITRGTDFYQLNVTLSDLRDSDTGFYFCEFSYAITKSSDLQFFSNSQEVFLFIEVSEKSCQCSRYPPVLYVISAAVVLLLIPLIWLCAVKCAKVRNQQKPPTSVPIYEEMNRGRLEGGKSQNIHPGQSHLKEIDNPVYC